MANCVMQVNPCVMPNRVSNLDVDPGKCLTVVDTTDDKKSSVLLGNPGLLRSAAHQHEAGGRIEIFEEAC